MLEIEDIETRPASFEDDQSADLPPRHSHLPSPRINNSWKNSGRRILSRHDHRSIGVLSTLSPGQRTEGCLVCCSAPACCPLFSICPCCGEADYISRKIQSSTYIFIRENSIEWNEPEVVLHPGVCCGVDPCLYDVQDRVQVVYFDDVMFDRVTDKTRFCNECRTCCFGGKGERIRMDAPTCCGCCQRGSFPCICIPFCCPKSFCPCILRFEIYVDDAQKGLYEIKKARESALKSDLFTSSEDRAGKGDRQYRL
jgi:hypothetical protein